MSQTYTTSQSRGKYALHGAVLTAAQTPNFSAKMRTVPVMVWDIISGAWGSHLGARRKLLFAVLVALYVVSPLDFFPEAIFLIPGLLDDVALSLFATSTILNLAGEYLETTTVGPAEPMHASATRLR